MRCPYQDCGEELSFNSDRSYCDSCFRPLVICLGCESAQRAFSRFCAQCGEQIRLPDLDTKVAHSLKDKIQPIRISGVSLLNPEMVSFGGTVWLMSQRGEIFDTSAGPRLKRRTTLPGRNFTFPLHIEEDDQRGPVIYANNNQKFYRYSILSDKYEELFTANGNDEVFSSSVLRTSRGSFYLTQNPGREFLKLRSAPPLDWSYDLDGLTPFISNVPPLCQIGNDLWVIGREKLIVFPEFLPAERAERVWNPMRAWISKKGIRYSKRLETGHLGDKQSLTFVTFEGKDFELYPADAALPLTTKVAVSLDDGQTATFASDSIKTYDVTMNLVSELPPIVQVRDPEGIFFKPPLLFWFEATDRSVYAWWTETSRVWKLWSFDQAISFSRFVLVGGSLYGLAQEDVWRWDLLAA